MERLRAIVEYAFTPMADGETAEAKLEGCKAELTGEFTRILKECDPADIQEQIAAIDALARECHERSRALPEDVQRQHFDWLRRDRGWFKPLIGEDGRLRAPDLPAGSLSVPLEIVPALHNAITTLRYGIHRREHPAPCDCAAIEASGLEREPDCPERIPIGEVSDGYHVGPGFRCASCGASWLEAAKEGSHFKPFWTRLP